MAIRERMKEVKKAWGREIWIVNCPEYCAKLLCLDKGARVSWHKHLKKKETMYGLEGSALLVIEDNEHLLTPFNLPKTIMPGERHTFYGITDAVILEVSTHHDDADSVRFTSSQPGLAKNTSGPTVISIDRDGVLAWGNPPGPVTAEHIRKLKEKGYIVGTGGGASGQEQEAQWLANGVKPDFALSKGELPSLRTKYPDSLLVHVDNEPVVVVGFKVISPEELLEWVK